MAVVIKASTKAIEEAKTQGDAENVPAGYHIMKLQKVETGKSKSDNAQLICSYKLVGLGREGKKPDKNYWPVRDYVTLDGETTEWKRAEFLLAMGVDKAGRGGTKLEIEPNKPGTVIGKLVIVRVVEEDYNGEARPKVGKVLPYVEPVDGLDEESDEGEIPDEDEVLEEEVVEEEVVEEEYVPWEREALKAEGKEKIKEVAASFDVAIVNGMTMKDILDAIMEAQENYIRERAGDPVEGAEVDEEDEPF